MTTFTWLHLTDLHLGMAVHPSLLPALKDRFFEDLKPLYEKSGPWDLVIFTGDLTQRGMGFDQIDKFLAELWDQLKALGSDPPLVAIPGNHDLVRPDPEDAHVVLLNEWPARPNIQNQFWNNPDSPYRKVVTEAFKNYVEWWDKTPKKLSIEKGVLPGDFSASLEKDGARLGIVGLNSTFLQLGEGDYTGKLAVSPIQFQKVCKGDGPAWVKDHNVSLLLTHQPPDWLTPEAKGELRGEIAPYFDVHLFGHMHEGRYQSVAEAGQPPQRTFQGMSVFGIEFLGEKQQQERRHGYAVGRIILEGEKGSWLFWPRRADRPGQGQWNFAPASQDYVLKEEHVRAEEFDLRKPLSPLPPVVPAVPAKKRGVTGKRWAILVGVNDYKNFPKLNYCRNDIVKLAQSLRDPLKFDYVFEFIEPQRHVIFDKLAELRDIKDDDLLLFYFSGHGLNIGGYDYLLPIEAAPRTAKNLGIKVDDLVGALTDTGCKNITMFIDACRAVPESDARGEASIGDESRAAISKAEIVTFFSCESKDRSFEIDDLQHGSFTWCILQAIKKGTATTALELDTYLKENVPQVNRDHKKPVQRPRSIIEPDELNQLEILFNPQLQQEMLAMFQSYSRRLYELLTEKKIEEAIFWGAGAFLRHIERKRQRDADEKVKLGMIQALFEGIRTPEEFCWAWKASLSPSEASPQIASLSRTQASPQIKKNFTPLG